MPRLRKTEPRKPLTPDQAKAMALPVDGVARLPYSESLRTWIYRAQGNGCTFAMHAVDGVLVVLRLK